MSSTRLKPLSDEERLERQHWRDELHQRHLEQEAEREHRQAVAAESERQEAAEALAQANREARIQLRERQRQEYEARQRQLDLTDLRLEARQSALWRNTVQNAVAYQQRQTLLNELEAAMTPPPPPESVHTTEIIYTSEDEAGSPHLGDRDFNPKLWMQKPRRWW